jgi:hypothetical protein
MARTRRGRSHRRQPRPRGLRPAGGNPDFGGGWTGQEVPPGREEAGTAWVGS